jgi:hypothetical protein
MNAETASASRRGQPPVCGGQAPVWRDCLPPQGKASSARGTASGYWGTPFGSWAASPTVHGNTLRIVGDRPSDLREEAPFGEHWRDGNWPCPAYHHSALIHHTTMACLVLRDRPVSLNQPGCAPSDQPRSDPLGWTIIEQSTDYADLPPQSMLNLCQSPHGVICGPCSFFISRHTALHI